jgi:hypothetical protein
LHGREQVPVVGILKMDTTVYNWLYVEDDIVWFESADHQSTLDLPLHFSCYDENNVLREYTLSETDEVKLHYTDDGAEIFALSDQKALYVKSLETDDGFEIEGIQIFQVVTKH